MTEPRTLLTVVCPEGHTLARVTGSPDGPQLTIKHQAVGTLPHPGAEVRVESGPQSDPMPLRSAAPSTEAVCVGCGKEFFLDPRPLHAALTAGRRRVVVHPIAF